MVTTISKKNVMYLLLSVSMLVRGMSDEELFLQGNQWYKNHDVAKAQECYEKIKNKGPAIWYNLANCAYYNGNYQQAALLWQFVLANACKPLQQKCRENLSILKNEHPELNLEEYTTSFSYPLPSLSLFWLQVLVLMVTVVICFFVVKKKLRGSRLFGLMLIQTIPLIVFFHHYTQEQRCGLVLKETICAYAGPDASFHGIGELCHGENVTITAVDKEWCKIKTKKLVGWVLLDTLAVI